MIQSSFKKSQDEVIKNKRQNKDKTNPEGSIEKILKSNKNNDSIIRKVLEPEQVNLSSPKLKDVVLKTNSKTSVLDKKTHQQRKSLFEPKKLEKVGNTKGNGLKKFRVVACLVLFSAYLNKQKNDNMAKFRKFSLNKFVYYYTSEQISNKINNWIFDSIKTPYLSLLKMDFCFDISNKSVMEKSEVITSEQNEKYMKLEPRLKILMDCLTELVTKEIPYNVLDFLGCLITNKSLIPAKFLPYFVLARLDIKDGQLK